MTTGKDPLVLHETLDAAAQSLREAVYLTRPAEDAPGLVSPPTVYLALGDLAQLARYLPQLCGQLGDFLMGEYAAGKVASDTCHDAGAEVMEVSTALIRAASAFAAGEKALSDAHNVSATLKAAE